MLYNPFYPSVDYELRSVVESSAAPTAFPHNSAPMAGPPTTFGPSQSSNWGKTPQNMHNSAPLAAPASKYAFRPSKPMSAPTDSSYLDDFMKVKPDPVEKPPEKGLSNDLKAYVQRCYESCHSSAEKDRMELRLKEYLTGLKASGTLGKINWSTQPLLTVAPAEDVIPVPRSREHRGRHRSSSRSRSRSRSPSPKAPAPKKGKKGKKAKDGKADLAKWDIKIDESKLNKRAQRFAGMMVDDSEEEPAKRRFVVSGPVVGTCTNLEKKFLRLTTLPDPSVIRPKAVLWEALKHCQEKYATDYHNFCEQMKSIRQDMTVQSIRDDLAIMVYETHARKALDYKDLGEFNQCQTQLDHLYRLVSTDDAFRNDRAFLCENAAEFYAYRILYTVAMNANQHLLTSLSNILEEGDRSVYPGNVVGEQCVKHAVAVAIAVYRGDWLTFWKLLKITPNRGKQILGTFSHKLRLSTFKILCKTYQPTIARAFLQKQLGFETPAELDDYLTLVKASVNEGGDILTTATWAAIGAKDVRDFEDLSMQEQHEINPWNF